MKKFYSCCCDILIIVTTLFLYQILQVASVEIYVRKKICKTYDTSILQYLNNRTYELKTFFNEISFFINKTEILSNDEDCLIFDENSDSAYCKMNNIDIHRFNGIYNQAYENIYRMEKNLENIKQIFCKTRSNYKNKLMDINCNIMVKEQLFSLHLIFQKLYVYNKIKNEEYEKLKEYIKNKIKKSNIKIMDCLCTKNENTNTFINNFILELFHQNKKYKHFFCNATQSYNKKNNSIDLTNIINNICVLFNSINKEMQKIFSISNYVLECPLYQ